MAAEDSTHRERRGFAAAFGLCAVATATLLASHPGGGGGAGGFAEFLKAEARNQLIDGVVHGGFIVTVEYPHRLLRVVFPPARIRPRCCRCWTGGVLHRLRRADCVDAPGWVCVARPLRPALPARRTHRSWRWRRP